MECTGVAARDGFKKLVVVVFVFVVGWLLFPPPSASASMTHSAVVLVSELDRCSSSPSKFASAIVDDAARSSGPTPTSTATATSTVVVAAALDSVGTSLLLLVDEDSDRPAKRGGREGGVYPS